MHIWVYVRTSRMQIRKKWLNQLKNFFNKRFWEYYLASFCWWISSSCENHCTLMYGYFRIHIKETLFLASSVIFSWGFSIWPLGLAPPPPHPPSPPPPRRKMFHWVRMKVCLYSRHVLYLFTSLIFRYIPLFPSI